MKIGIDIGGSHIAIGLVDNMNNLIVKKGHNWTEYEKKDLYKINIKFNNRYKCCSIGLLFSGMPKRNTKHGFEWR